MKVLILPEDPTYDQYILKPIVDRIFNDLGRAARIEVLQNPRLTSVSQALDPAILSAIVDKYPMMDLFLVLVDRDGDVEWRPIRARAREEGHPGKLIVCLAIEAVEVWMLALHRNRLSTRSWREVRVERHP